MDPTSNRCTVDCGTNILADLLNKGKVHQTITKPCVPIVKGIECKKRDSFEFSCTPNSRLIADNIATYAGWPAMSKGYSPYSINQPYSLSSVQCPNVEMRDDTRQFPTNDCFMNPIRSATSATNGNQNICNNSESNMFMSTALCMYMSLKSNNKRPIPNHQLHSYHPSMQCKNGNAPELEIRSLSREGNPSPDKTDADSGICTDSEQDEPMDLSYKPRDSAPSSLSSKNETSRNLSPAAYSDIADDSSESLLRGLLSRNQVKARKHSLETASPNTKVRLAKKNLFPVSARVSDWLVKIVQFADSIQEYKMLTQNDRVALVLGSWSRLLLLHMAENNFHFVVSPDSVESPRPHSPELRGQSLELSQLPVPTSVPTMRSVEVLQGLINKYQAMGLDRRQYELLQISILFHNDSSFLENPQVIEQIRRDALNCLQHHASSSHPDDVMHYSKLLMSLPTLYSVDPKMVENLFCRHITGNMDVAVFIKEMLKSL